VGEEKARPLSPLSAAAKKQEGDEVGQQQPHHTVCREILFFE